MVTRKIKSYGVPIEVISKYIPDIPGESLFF